MSNASPSLPPGFRFHPTDEELILHYLYKRAAASPPCPIAIIADINIYKFNPWDLPAKAMFGEREWYFFSPRDRKYPNGVRPNRSAGSGYWKATGTDKPIGNIGVKKALVFYTGKPPKGVKTDWIMHEYRLVEALHNSQREQQKLKRGSMRLDDWVLCRIYQKTRHNSPSNCLLHEEEAETKNFANANQMMHKSFSISEFLIEEEDFTLLSGLLETQTDAMPSSNHDPTPSSNLNQAFAGTNNGICSGASLLIADQTLKRRRMVESYCYDECGGLPNPSKKLRNSNIYEQILNQFDLSQPFFNQQLVLNSQ